MALILCLVGLLILGLNSPQPRRSTITGELEAVAFGHIIPKWAFYVFGVPLLFGAHYLFTKLIDFIWREPENIQAEKVFAREDGGYVAWVPEEPGTPSPMEYKPPTLDEHTTAKEFLTIDPPNAMRTLLGVDTMKEIEEFDQLLIDWLRSAPAETLRNLIPTAEELKAARQLDDDAVYRLFQAHTERGIPSKEELEAITGEPYD